MNGLPLVQIELKKRGVAIREALIKFIDTQKRASILKTLYINIYKYL